MDVSVIGAGYVGLTTAACLAELGHHVLCADNDLAKLDLLQSGKMPFYEPFLESIVTRNKAVGRLAFASSQAAIEHSNIFFICVGTPPLENGEADLSAIEAVAHEIGKHSKGYCVVIEKSTVPVQTAQRLKRHFATCNSTKLECDVVSNPEFLREGSSVYDFFHPARIVIGTDSERATRCMEEIYRSLFKRTFTCPMHPQCVEGHDVRLVVTDTNSAELVKHASNSFLAMKISFVNMVSNLCEVVGADVEKVVEGIGLDPRIGASFLLPGIGFGGFCFPKDLQAFVRIAEKFGCDFSLLKEVEKINQRRVDELLIKLERELWVLRGKTVAILGLAFKPNTDDVRFAPALTIIRRLLAAGVKIQAYDPQAMEKAKAEICNIRYCETPYGAAAGSDAVVIATEWDEFTGLDWSRMKTLMKRPLVVDGRNMFSPGRMCAEGFDYISIGRLPAYKKDLPRIASDAKEVLNDALAARVS